MNENTSAETPETTDAETGPDPRDVIIARLNAALEEAIVELELDLAA